MHLPVSSAHNYESNAFPHHSSITSSKPVSHHSTALEATLHRTHGRATNRQQAADECVLGGERGPHTYSVALRWETEERHHTSHGLSLDQSSETWKLYRNDFPRRCTPTAVHREQEHYRFVDNSQR